MAGFSRPIIVPSMVTSFRPSSSSSMPTRRVRLISQPIAAVTASCSVEAIAQSNLFRRSRSLATPPMLPPSKSTSTPSIDSPSSFVRRRLLVWIFRRPVGTLAPTSASTLFPPGQEGKTGWVFGAASFPSSCPLSSFHFELPSFDLRPSPITWRTRTRDSVEGGDCSGSM